MPEWLIGVLVVGGFFLAVGLLFYSLLQRDIKRTKELKEIAQLMGLAFKEQEDAVLFKNKFQNLPLFQKGDKATAHNIMFGTIGNSNIYTCDYRYWSVHLVTTEEGTATREGTKVTQTAICIELPGGNLPAFDITPNSNYFTFTSYDRKEAISFDDNPEFGSKYSVCPENPADKESIQNLITPEIQSQLMKFKQIKLEAGGNQIVLSTHLRRIKVADFKTHVDCAVTVGNKLMG